MARDIDRDQDPEMVDQGAQHSLEGKKDKLKGRMKDAFGGLTGDTSKQAEGKWDKLKGSAKDKLGEVERDVGEGDQDDLDETP